MKKDRREFFKITASSALAAALLPSVYYAREKPESGPEGAARKSKVEQALSLFEKYNCCQSVLAAYSPELGMERNLALRAAAGMPGIGGLGNVCGTVSGATLVIGLKTMNENNIRDPEARHKTSDTVKEFVARFEERHSSIKCKELLGCDISTPEGYRQAKKNNLFKTKCPKFVESAVDILEELFS